MKHPNFIPHAIALIGFATAYAWLSQRPGTEPLVLQGIGYVVLAATVAFAFKILGVTPRALAKLRSTQPTGLKGTAAWASKKEIRKVKSNKRRGYLAGMKGKFAVWLSIESSALILAPAGSGKTRDFVIPALMSQRSSMIVADLKGTLAAITAKFRRKVFGHKIYILNPGGRFHKILGKGARFNPLQILMRDWSDPERHKFLMSDARMLASQLLPEPIRSGENEFFRNGSRKLLVFAMLYLVATTGKVTLSRMLDLLSDLGQLTEVLILASEDERLKGDLSRMAKDILGKMTEGRPEQLESFREGALQVLEPFSPSGVLADATEESDFEFADLRRKKGTVYIVCDPTQQDAFASWLGLVMESAKTELMRQTDGKEVVFMVDEATNFRFKSLPGLLTSAREFKLRMILVVQELEQWAHVYGREALDTLLSQTELKIIHGTQSQKTAQLVSDMLGEYSVMTTSVNEGQGFFDRAQKTKSEAGRRLLMPDEVRKCDKAIVFYRNTSPMLLNRIGYHEVSPWWRQAAPNPLFGKKRYKGKIKLRL